MDWSWLGNVENPIAMLLVCLGMFTGALLVIVSRFSRLVDSFLRRSEGQTNKMMEVIEENTATMAQLTETNRSLSDAVHRIADTVDDKLEVAGAAS